MNFFEQVLAKKIIFVGGKGGVGKTTSSAALALLCAQRGRKTLIISTDPAHSLGDVLSVRLNARIMPVVENLDALELDTHEIITEHFATIEKTLSSYTKPAMMAKMREFLRLSQHSPGAEEAAMLEAMCQYVVNYQEIYDHIIFDTAPTGHTLRLLTLPEMMQAWTDGLIAQQKHQQQLREASYHLDRKSTFNPFVEEDNRFAKAIFALRRRRELFAKTRAILHNPHQCAIILVLIAESLPIFETRRTLEHLKQSKLPCGGLIVNQVLSADQPNQFWQQRASRSHLMLAEIDKLAKEYSPLKQIFVPLKQDDIRGVHALSSFYQDAVEPSEYPW